MKNYLSETEGIIVGLFCAPPHGSNGNPNYMTEENYRALKEAGVDLIMGNNEIFSTPEEGYAFASIALCEKTGLKYFAYDDLSGYFYSIGKLCPWTKNKKAFWEYSEQEKKDLLERYAKSLERYMKNDTCVGVKFSDEIGWAMLDGIKYAKDYFDKEYPDEKMLELSKKIKVIVDDKSRYTDWSTRDDIKANLQVDLILLLDEYGYPPVTLDDVYKEVLEQAENFKKYAG